MENHIMDYHHGEKWREMARNGKWVSRTHCWEMNRC